MKRTVKLVGLLVLLAILTLCLVACNEPTPPPTPGPGTVSDLEIFKDGTNPNEYTIIYPDGKANVRSDAMDVNGLVYSILGGDRNDYMPISDAQAPVSAYEILIGETNRELSKELAAKVNANTEAFRWGIAVKGNSIALYAADSIAWDMCFKAFTEYVTGDSLIVASNLYRIEVLSQEDYDQNQVDIKNEKNKEEIEELQSLIAAFREGDFYGSTKRYAWADVKDQVEKTTTEDKPGRYKVSYDAREVVDMTEALAQQPYNAPAAENCPTVGQHPRLLFTEEDIPAIKAALNDPACATAYKTLKGYLGSEFDGKLEPIVYTDPVAYKAAGHRSLSNYSTYGLAVIQGKAFYYAITGELLYGYQAVYAMMNYLDTLDIGYFDSDQCRYYGHTAYTAALVYDWCYDLMSPELREMMALGIQNSCFLGYSSLPEGSVNNSGKKSETNFPPIGGTGPVEGHGSEMELLRDYLSVAIAIYDEHPDWYNLIGGRMFDHYIPIRNYYYSSAGAYPEGTACYAPWRYLADEYSAWMLTSALGENPFDPSMQQVVRSMAARVLNSKMDIFSTDDGGGTSAGSMYQNAAISSYLYDDEYMRAFANYVFSVGGSTGCANVTATELLICASRGMEKADHFYDGLDTITYNAGYLQEIVARRDWSDNSPAILMRGASSTTYGHSHQASGKFQIYYKGMLSGSDGVYDNYGSNHHYYYHKATISHSCLLVFNPRLKSTDNGFYSGGQPKGMGVSDTNEYKSFINGRLSTGKVLGVKYGYNLDGTAKYVYYDNDLTKGYAINRVDYVGRTMLTVFPEDPTYPMILFIYDRINVPEPDYTKSFLLQCAKEPQFDSERNVYVVDNGNGKMILHPLVGCGTMNAYGGDTGEAPQRYWISTQNKNCPSFGGLSSGGTGAGGGRTNNWDCWGKIEIQSPAGNLKDVMLNVVYVTDSTNDEYLKIESIRGVGYEGAKAGNQVAIFAYGEDGISLSTEGVVFSVNGLEGKEYYIGGLAAGTWHVSVGDQDLGMMTVKDGEHMITFSALGAGTVSITPVKAPANAEN